MKTLFALAALIGLAPLAHADDRSAEILNHPVVTSLVFLGQTDSGAQCEEPRAEDIRWFCTGLIPPVKQPEIMAMGCGFALDLRCPGKGIRVTGQVKHYYLNTPRPNKVARTAEEIVISDVSIRMP